MATSQSPCPTELKPFWQPSIRSREAACRLISCGIPVVLYHPHEGRTCLCGFDRCHRAGKHPRAICDTSEELDDAWQSGANIGASTGSESGLLVIDIDLPEVPDDLAGELDRTLTVRTGKGWHLYYRRARPALPYPLRDYVDVRHEGSSAVLPPSVHANGKQYTFLNDLPPAAPPQWMTDQLNHIYDTVKLSGNLSIREQLTED